MPSVVEKDDMYFATGIGYVACRSCLQPATEPAAHLKHSTVLPSTFAAQRHVCVAQHPIDSF